MFFLCLPYTDKQSVKESQCRETQSKYLWQHTQTLKAFSYRGSVWQLQLLNIYIKCVHMCPSLPTCLLVSRLLFIMQWLCVHASVSNVCLVMSVCWATVVVHIHLNSSCMVDAKQLWFENSQLHENACDFDDIMTMLTGWWIGKSLSSYQQLYWAVTSKAVEREKYLTILHTMI